MMSKTPNTETQDKKHHLITAPIVTLSSVIEATTLSKSTLLRMIDNNQFPQPIAISQRRCGFYAHEINQWLTERPRLTNLSTLMENGEDA